MKKGEKAKGYRVWETMLLNKSVKGESTTLQEATTRTHKMAPSPALVAIIERVLKLDIEEPIKYPFPDEGTAQNFRTALTVQVKRMLFEDKIAITRGGGTVYVYRKA